VALKIFVSSGKKVPKAIITLYIKGETASAINMKAVPSFSIFQEIPEIAMGGLELCPNASLIPPVTILSANVRDNLHREAVPIAKLSY
jgi:hypothetical protein